MSSAKMKSGYYRWQANYTLLLGSSRLHPHVVCFVVRDDLSTPDVLSWQVVGRVETRCYTLRIYDE